MIMIDTDFSWTLRVYHNHQRHLRSIVVVVYFLRVTLVGARVKNDRQESGNPVRVKFQLAYVFHRDPVFFSSDR